jgi:selenide,water dikinase
MVVSGLIHPDKIIRNKGAKSGDILILTKPIGTGILSTAIKRGMVEKDLQQEVIASMSQLNKTAAELMLNYEIHACTDVTGFGLLGHLREMSRASICDVNISFDKIPFIREAKALATAGVIPGGTYNNLEYVINDVDFGQYSRTNQLLICDAQTSGGLLVAIKSEQAQIYLNDLHKAGISSAQIIGEFTNTGEGKITVL